MKTLFLESIAGIAGDMFAASFINAGLVSPNELQILSEKLGVPGINIQTTDVIRATMQATHIDVCFSKSEWLQRFSSLHHHKSSSDNVHIPFRALEQIIIHSTLAENTKILACNILHSLAEAEAHCHGVTKDEVAFHELGMLDSLMDIVMAAYCITKVSPDRIIASPVKLGRGLISTAHGTQPVPPPASASLAIGMPISSIPISIREKDIELSTPTGLAILKTIQPLFSQELPEGMLLANGCGAGTMELEGYPNLFRVSLLETKAKSHPLPYASDTVVEVTVNYDDETSEHLAWATKKLFELGALDVWQTTAVGKKGRVMIILSLLAEPLLLPKCLDFILRKTATFGLRYKYIDRLKLNRYFETRETNEGTFQVKVGCTNNGVKIREKFEFEDIKRSWDKDAMI